MPLTRATITNSSKVMLPVYFVFAMLVGAAYTFGDPSRTTNPTLDTIRGIMPLRYWGVLFILLAILQALAWWVHSRALLVAILRGACAIYASWTFGLLCALIRFKSEIPFFRFTEDTSFVGICLWAFVAAAHVATLQSLTRDSPRRPA